jgi:hypothetical protein
MLQHVAELIGVLATLFVLIAIPIKLVMLF